MTIAGSLVATTACYGDTPLDVAPRVDLQSFQGKWYEIARLPRTTQTDCTGTVASYWLRPGGDLDVVSECHVGTLDGPLKTMTATVKAPDARTPAKLAIEVGGFYGDYWILEVGEHYEYAVVGHPSREYLWILSRTPKLGATVLNGVLSRARASKFDVERLEYTPQG